MLMSYLLYLYRSTCTELLLHPCIIINTLRLSLLVQELAEHIYMFQGECCPLLAYKQPTTACPRNDSSMDSLTAECLLPSPDQG